MEESDFGYASASDRKRYILRPYDQVSATILVPGAESHLVFGQNSTLSFLTMKAGSVFDLHSHPAEQTMLVLEGYCDEVIDRKIYRIREGDLIHLPPNVAHGAFMREADCRAIDFFAPAREDYERKYRGQHGDARPRFG